MKEAFDRVVSFAGSIGMTVNVAKTEVCLISGSMDVDSICATFGGAKVIPYPKLELLGSPIGPTDSPDQLSRSVEIRLEQIATFGQRLQDLCSHHRLFLLKHCVGVPRLLYLIDSLFPLFPRAQGFAEHRCVVSSIPLRNSKCSSG